ncbi:hypothetical protein D3C72_2112790 [compost metagenome]
MDGGVVGIGQAGRGPVEERVALEQQHRPDHPGRVLGQPDEGFQHGFERLALGDALEHLVLDVLQHGRLCALAPARFQGFVQPLVLLLQAFQLGDGVDGHHGRSIQLGRGGRICRC